MTREQETSGVPLQQAHDDLVRAAAKRVAKLRWRTVGRLFALALFIGVVGGLAALSRLYPIRWDVTANTRFSLAAETKAFLKTLPGPVAITAYLKKGSDLRAVVREIVALYQEVKPDLILHIVDPASVPLSLRRNTGAENGTLAVQYNERTAYLRTFRERDLTNAMAKLMRSAEGIVAFVTGHGERSPQRSANHDLSLFADELKGRGIRAVDLNLAESHAIPTTATLLVLASPATAYLPGEAELIRQYVQGGGNLLWMMEAGKDMGLTPLAADLGVSLVPGTVIDPSGTEYGTTEPTMTVITRYKEHPALGGAYATVTVWPYSVGLQMKPVGGFLAAPLWETHASAWAETGAVGGIVTFEEGRDLRGPLYLAYALSRRSGKREQRVVVMGGGSGLANQYLANGGNADVGVRVVEWLVESETLINIPTRPARDRALLLDPMQGRTMALTLLCGLPIFFLGTACVLWIRQRRR
jgi:ABC-type uncharacterized transport system involved in gliding motility auxiliary subunit